VTATLVSVVIPFYAGGDDAVERLGFLEECLASLRNQTLREWEALVVDDGSPDGRSVRELVERHQDERVRYLRHPANRGPGAARNTGFKAGRASLLLPLDSDDRLHRAFLERTHGLLSRHEEIDCVFTQFRVFGEVDRIWAHTVLPWEEILRAQWIPGAGTLMRRRTWQIAGGYAELPLKLGNEDWDFWIAALSRGIRSISLAEPLYEYRRWPGSLTFSYPPPDGHVVRRIIYSRHRSLFREHGCSRSFLAGGYLNSSIAARHVGQRGTSLRLAARGLVLSPRNTQLWLRVAISLLPIRAERDIGALRDDGSAQVRALATSLWRYVRKITALRN
jgi:glycosyltransferase involved in cell wall biosynthesis